MSVVTILESCPAEVVLFFENYEKAVAISDHAEDLAGKASRVAPKARRVRTKANESLSAIWKELREDGTLPEDPQVAVGLHKTVKAQNVIIRKALKKKKLDGKSRKVFSDAASLYRSDNRTIYEERIVGHAIVPQSKIDPAVLARLETIRKAKSNNNK